MATTWVWECISAHGMMHDGDRSTSFFMDSLAYFRKTMSQQILHVFKLRGSVVKLVCLQSRLRMKNISL